MKKVVLTFVLFMAASAGSSVTLAQSNTADWNASPAAVVRSLYGEKKNVFDLTKTELALYFEEGIAEEIFGVKEWAAESSFDILYTRKNTKFENVRIGEAIVEERAGNWRTVPVRFTVAGKERVIHFFLRKSRQGKWRINNAHYDPDSDEVFSLTEALLKILSG